MTIWPKLCHFNKFIVTQKSIVIKFFVVFYMDVCCIQGCQFLVLFLRTQTHDIVCVLKNTNPQQPAIKKGVQEHLDVAECWKLDKKYCKMCSCLCSQGLRTHFAFVFLGTKSNTHTSSYIFCMTVRSRVGIPAPDFAPRNTNPYVVCVLTNLETSGLL